MKKIVSRSSIIRLWFSTSSIIKCNSSILISIHSSKFLPQTSFHLWISRSWNTFLSLQQMKSQFARLCKPYDGEWHECQYIWKGKLCMRIRTSTSWTASSHLTGQVIKTSMSSISSTSTPLLEWENSWWAFWMLSLPSSLVAPIFSRNAILSKY